MGKIGKKEKLIWRSITHQFINLKSDFFSRDTGIEFSAETSKWITFGQIRVYNCMSQKHLDHCKLLKFDAWNIRRSFISWKFNTFKNNVFYPKIPCQWQHVIIYVLKWTFESAICHADIDNICINCLLSWKF